MSDKISIRFYNDRPVRAVWDEGNSKWWFSVLDIIAIFNAQDDYAKTRNYWKYLKTKLKKEAPQLVSVTNQLKLTASDGKRYNTDTLDAQGVTELAKHMPKNKTLNKKSMCSSKECIRIITENKDLIEKKYGVKSITLFGSVARGDNRQISHDAIQIL